MRLHDAKKAAQLNPNKLRKLPRTILFNMTKNTFGARVAFESSWACAFSRADPSKIEGSSRIKSLDPIDFKDINNVYAVDQIYECKGPFFPKIRLVFSAQ